MLVLADPAVMAGQPEAARRASAMNALAHAAEALYGPGRNPVAALAGARAATLLARGVEAGDRDDLALGAVLAGYALGSAGFSLHHVLCQTVVRVCGTSHSVTNAAVLPFALEAMATREPAAIAELAAALHVGPDGVAERVSALGGGARLGGEGVSEADLPRVADAALERSELDALSPPPDRDELVAILRAHSDARSGDRPRRCPRDEGSDPDFRASGWGSDPGDARERSPSARTVTRG